MRYFFIVISICFLSACQLTQQPKTSQTVDMYNRDGDMVGRATLSEDPKGVKIKVTLEGLTPGFHGIHIHEIGKCEAPDFKSAGNHLNPEKKKHGLLHPEGPHLGDLPNVEADSSGKVDTELTVNDATLLKEKNSLTERGGTSLVITAEADDGMSQISGNSGERIICGEIKGEKGGTDNQEPTDPTEKEKKK
ncbi:superoxide dismutase family protein [Pseudogracilibacillus sp. SO30301A]|uniref:superoxide dismutase family protein n=1 Tax=Pseudogracilibacillus sp. SO30301A TaxID=3098291 RepID=UPI00300E4D94